LLPTGKAAEDNDYPALLLFFSFFKKRKATLFPQFGVELGIGQLYT
jgi:hypothetical protein